MRNVELYLDSRLKEFKLYNDMEKILRGGVTESSSNLSIDEVQSLSLFKEFVDLATLLDSYSGWSEGQWTNFMTQMVLAFKEKGKASSINCVLAALGISTVGEAVIENVGTDPSVKTKIHLTINKIDTPNIDKFLSRLEALFPKLLWLHEVDNSSFVAQTVTVSISLSDVYYKEMSDRSIRYSEPIGSVSASSWGV